MKFGKTPSTLICTARNTMTRETINTIESKTIVKIGLEGKPKAHGKKKKLNL